MSKLYITLALVCGVLPSILKAESVLEFQQRLNAYKVAETNRQYERIESEQRKFNANIAAGIEQSLYGGTRADAIQNQYLLNEIGKSSERARPSENVFIFGGNNR